MEGDKAPISYVPLRRPSVVEFAEYLISSTHPDFYQKINQSAIIRFRALQNEIHDLSLVLNPSIPRDCWASLTVLMESKERFLSDICVSVLESI